jgi:hypothetical protein
VETVEAVEASVQRRLEELRAERMTGLRRLEDLSREFESVRETVLRIGGAIQVLEELFAEGPPEAAGGPPDAVPDAASPAGVDGPPDPTG